MISRYKRTALPVMVLASALLAGCSGSAVVGGDSRMGYAMLDVLYAMNGRDALVEIHGNPFGETEAVFAKQVTDAMRNRAFGVNANFTTTPNDGANRHYRVVIAFNPTGEGHPTDRLAGRVCRLNPVPTAPPAKGPPYKLYVEAALCSDGGDLDTARGWLDNASGPDDPGFRHLVGDTTATLFRGPEGDSALFP